MQLACRKEGRHPLQEAKMAKVITRSWEEIRKEMQGKDMPFVISPVPPKLLTRTDNPVLPEGAIEKRKAPRRKI